MSDQIKILCVDDEKNVLKALSRSFMEEENYDIYLAESGAEGLQVLGSTDGIRLVISDYRMPGMTGVEFLRQVNERWPNTVRIVLSGYADTAVVVEAVNLGHIYKFIPKPWDDNDLLMTIKAALAYQELRRENSSLNVSLQEKNKELEHKNLELTELNNHLESMVAERTEALELRNRVLQLSQSILDVLPLAVFGIDAEGCIVHGNNAGCALFSQVEFGPLGHQHKEVFPEQINALIERLLDNHQAQAEKVSINEHHYYCQAHLLGVKAVQGLVLTLIPDSSTSAGEQ